MNYKYRCWFCSRSARNVEMVEVREEPDGRKVYTWLCQQCRTSGAWKGAPETTMDIATRKFRDVH